MIWRLALAAAAACLSACGDGDEGATATRENGVSDVEAKESELWALRAIALPRPAGVEDTLPAGRTIEPGAADIIGDDGGAPEGWVREAETELAKIGAGNELPRLTDGFLASELMPAETESLGDVAGFGEMFRVGDTEPAIGSGAFPDEVRRLRERFSTMAPPKIISVNGDGEAFRTEVLIALHSPGREGHARWDCLWRRDELGVALAGLRVLEHREVSRAGPALFEDLSASVLPAGGPQMQQIVHGIPHFAKRVTRFGDLALTGHHGIAVGDVDGDGRVDLFVADGGSLPNRLYRQLGDGSTEEIARQAGVAWLEDSRAALLVDLDNDGDQDLVVATIAMIAFAENDGRGRFGLRGGFPRAQYPFSLAAADYDLDGDLDIYVCVYGEGDQAVAGRGFEAQSPVPYDDAQNGGRNVLLENLGGFGFADVTDEVGLGAENTRWSFAAAWEDYDRDGDADLYVANDFGRNCLYRNEGGRFEEVAVEQGVGDLAAGMSVSWGDYNRDGRPDVYVGNMFSSAGLRLASVGGLAPASDERRRRGLRRMALGNSLFAGDIEGFVEVPAAAGAAVGRWAWSSGFADINNDGWEDLVVANGYLTGWQGDGDL